MKTEEHIVNLDVAPKYRWEFLVDYKQEVNDLIGCYLKDFEGSEFIFEAVELYKANAIPADYLDEIDFISSITTFTANEVLIANLYYDALKFYFGCTAFAVHNNDAILHSRNLDWHTENNLLSKHSRIFDFQKNGVTICKTIGWFGFIGALSGINPGKFSLTLNAVLSNDSPELAYPVSFLLRDILVTANSFSEARNKLESTAIASDCLLLLSGITKNEIVVIERTPKRFKTRKAGGDFIIVTNDYKELENSNDSTGLLQSTSCGRYDRAKTLLNLNLPESTEECIAILQDEGVQMGITVQQMSFNNKTGEIRLVKT